MAPHSKTLWEVGRRPGPVVAAVAGLVLLGVATADLAVFDDLTLLFDVAFVVVCTAAALAVRPRDFFVVGVLPPLLMAAVIAVLALVSRSTVADPGDGFLQTLVSGLAHQAGALVVGYALALVVLALRQVARRNSGAIRAAARPVPPRVPHVPRQRGHDDRLPAAPQVRPSRRRAGPDAAREAARR